MHRVKRAVSPARLPLLDDDDNMDAITTATEFTQLCTRLEPFIHHGEGALEMRTAVILFAHCAKSREWPFEAVVTALRGTPCYPDSITDADSRATHTRYMHAIDLLLTEYLRE